MIPRRRLGNTSLEVSALGFGAGAIGSADQAAVDRLVYRAIDLGVTLIDTAPSYGASEELLGRTLAPVRDRVQLSTKGGYGVPGVEDWTGEVIRRGVDLALSRMNVEKIDIFHLHSCPREILLRDDILRALEDIRRSGKVLVPAYSGENDALAAAVELDVIGSIQCSVNICDQRAISGAITRANSRGLGVIGKRPIANAPWRFVSEPFGDYAQEYWRRMKQMRIEPADLDTFLRFSTFTPGVHSVIVGTSRLEHLEECVDIIERGPLARELREEILLRFVENDRGWEGQV